MTTRAIILAITILLISKCTIESGKHTSHSNGSQETKLSGATSTRKKLIEYDSMFALKRGIRVFYKRTNSDTIDSLVSNQWPEDIETIYNLYTNDTTHVSIFKEIPSIESGDFSIVHSYYFLEDGKLFAVKNKIKFFSEACSDKAIEETRIGYFNAKGDQYLSEYDLIDTNGNKLDSGNCNFGDIPNFNIYSTLREIPIYISK